MEDTIRKLLIQKTFTIIFCICFGMSKLKNKIVYPNKWLIIVDIDCGSKRILSINFFK